MESASGVADRLVVVVVSSDSSGDPSSFPLPSSGLLSWSSRCPRRYPIGSGSPPLPPGTPIRTLSTGRSTSKAIQHVEPSRSSYRNSTALSSSFASSSDSISIGIGRIGDRTVRRRDNRPRRRPLAWKTSYRYISSPPPPRRTVGRSRRRKTTTDNTTTTAERSTTASIVVASAQDIR